MDFDEEKVDPAVLALLYLTLHDKSVVLTDEGLEEARRLFQELFGKSQSA